MRVLLFSPISSSLVGGAELYLQHFASFLRTRGHRVKLVTGPPFRHALRWHWPTDPTKQKLTAAFRWADVCYCSYGFAGVDATLLSLSRHTKTPVFAGHHAPLLHDDPWHNAWMVTGGRLLLRRFTGHHVLAKEHARLLSHWGIRNVFFLPCGIDRMQFSLDKRRTPHTPLRLLFVGRPTRQKGLDVLQETVAHMDAGERRTFTLRILTGETPHYRIPTAMRWADVALVPSRFETSPAVVLEALSSGRPVLGSDIPPIRAFVTPGKTGWLVRPHDPRALARSITAVVQQLQKEPGQWRTMGRVGRTSTEQYDHNRLFLKLMQWMEGGAKNVKQQRQTQNIFTFALLLCTLRFTLYVS